MKETELFCRPSEERALLSYCMKDLSSYFSVCAKLSPSDFLYVQHQTIMYLFETLLAKGAEKLEPNLIVAEATATGILDDIGGIKYIQTIHSMVLDKSNFDLYLNLVCESTVKFKLHNLLAEKLNSVERNAKDGLTSIDLLSSIEASVLDLSMSKLNILEPIDLSDGLSEYIDNLKCNNINLSGLSTGYPILDKQIDGLVPGTLHVIAARKKEGKSAFLTNVALNAAYRLNTPVLYIDTELSFAEWRTRALAIIAGVDERIIKHGGYDNETYIKLKKAATLIKKGKLFHEYMPGYSVDKLVASYKKYHQKEKIGLILFDYLKEPDSSSVDRQRKEYQLLGDVTTKLKDLAGSLNIPALTAVQLNRDHDIADSDRIARYADIVCYWKGRTSEEIEEGGYECGSHKLIIKDTRRGGATSEKGIGYLFFKERLKIREVAIDKQSFINFNKIVNADSASENIKYSGLDNEDIF